MRLLLILVTLTGTLSGADLCKSIRNLVAVESRKQDIPAISVAIVRDNHLACSIAIGFSDLEQHVANTEKSRHRLASLSKPVTATLVMKLVEEGSVALDDSVRKFMTELPAEYNGVTLRRLLDHQSGIREYSGLEEVFSTNHFDNLSGAAESIFIKSPLLFQPGSATAYTTYGYTLLGAVLERVTGQTFRNILQARMPMFALDDYLALIPDRVRPYRKSSSGKWENAPAFDASNKYPGGGMIGTAADYANFLVQLRRRSFRRMQISIRR